MAITRHQLVIMTSMSGMKERSFHDLSIDVLVGGAVVCLCCAILRGLKKQLFLVHVSTLNISSPK